MRTRLLKWVWCVIVVSALLVAGCGGGTVGDGGGLTPARDLSGTWTSAIPVVYYTLNIYGERAMRVTANIAMQLQQSGSGVTGVITITPITQEPVGEMPIPDPGGPLTIDDGTVSSTNFTFTIASWTPSGGVRAIERWAFTFTTDLMGGTVTNLDTDSYFGRDSDTNAIHLIRS